MIRWVLAEGKEQDREVDEPKTTDEIVILNSRQVSGRAWGAGLDRDTESWVENDHDGFDDTVITFARAGNDDLLGWELTEHAAVSLYYKFEPLAGKTMTWAMVDQFTKRKYIQMAQAVLASVAEYIKEKRDAREGS